MTVGLILQRWATLLDHFNNPNNQNNLNNPNNPLSFEQDPQTVMMDNNINNPNNSENPRDIPHKTHVNIAEQIWAVSPVYVARTASVKRLIDRYLAESQLSHHKSDPHHPSNPRFIIQEAVQILGNPYHSGSMRSINPVDPGGHESNSPNGMYHNMDISAWTRWQLSRAVDKTESLVQTSCGAQ